MRFVRFSVLLTACVCLGSSLVTAQVKKTTKTPAKPAAKSTLATKATNPGTALRTQADTLSYAIGTMMGQQYRSQNLQNVSGALLGRAVDDVIMGRKPLLDEATAGAFLQAYSTRLHEQQAKQQAKQYEPVKKAGEAFLAANKTKDSVVTLPSGLQYKILKTGDGPKPTASEQVKTHYHGTLIDGKVFDSSVQRGEPITFPVTGVIPGWVEALQLMPVGSKWKLFVPYNLAYGERGSMPNIPPYSALIFEVELLGIEK
ncbi:MAG: FKBP-type peptidyl-prolyl cis-trans isomerase [Sphingobacteriaceae bacterium]|nr:FKBP-type peptidyl-prolyl cis-trans isomerase [Cytophagaceae bacterium]